MDYVLVKDLDYVEYFFLKKRNDSVERNCFAY